MGIELGFIGSTDTSAVSGSKGQQRGKSAVGLGEAAGAGGSFMAFLSQFESPLVDPSGASSGADAKSAGLPFSNDADTSVVAEADPAGPLLMDASALMLQMQMSMNGVVQQPSVAKLSAVASAASEAGGAVSATTVRSGLVPRLEGVANLGTSGDASGLDLSGLAVDGDMPTPVDQSMAVTANEMSGTLANLEAGSAIEASTPSVAAESLPRTLPATAVAGGQKLSPDLPVDPAAIPVPGGDGSLQAVVRNKLPRDASTSTSKEVPLADKLGLPGTVAVNKPQQRDVPTGAPKDSLLVDKAGPPGSVAADWRFSAGVQEASAPELEKPGASSPRALFNAGGSARNNTDVASNVTASASVTAVAAASLNESVRQWGERASGERTALPAAEVAPAAPTHRSDLSAPGIFDPSSAAGKAALDSASVANPMTGFTPEQHIAEQVSVWIGQNVQSAELKLDALGHDPVEVSISMSGNEAQVQFRSDAPETRDLLSRAVADLNSALQREGLVLSGVSVGTSDQPKDNAREAGENSRATGTSRQRSDGLAATEGVSLNAVPRKAQGAVDLFV